MVPLVLRRGMRCRPINRAPLPKPNLQRCSRNQSIPIIGSVIWSETRRELGISKFLPTLRLKCTSPRTRISDPLAAISDLLQGANHRAYRNTRESRPIRALARTARMPTNQSAERNPRAKYQPIRRLLGTRANADQSERLQERPRKSANQSACRNRANANQSERLQERAAQGLEHLQSEGHKY